MSEHGGSSCCQGASASPYRIDCFAPVVALSLPLSCLHYLRALLCHVPCLASFVIVTDNIVVGGQPCSRIVLDSSS